MKIKTIAFTVLLSSLCLACQDDFEEIEKKVLSSGIQMEDLDTSVRPGDDFYQYANGGWLKNHPIPDHANQYNKLSQLSEQVNMNIYELLDELAKSNYPDGSTEKKICDFYNLAMDTVRRNKDGVEPLMAYIRQMEKAGSMDELFDIEMQIISKASPFFMYVNYNTDIKDATKNILYLEQANMNLPNKDYYIGQDNENTRIREEYKVHIIKVMQSLGFSEQKATEKMNNIMHIKTELAYFSRSNTDTYNPADNYNRVTLSAFEADHPHINIERRINEYGLESEYFQEFVVCQPEFFAGLDSLFNSMTLNEYRDYMEWNLIYRTANYLDDNMRTLYFEFFEKTITGRKSPAPISEKTIMLINQNMGEAFGKVYVQKHFTPEKKERIMQLVINLKSAMADHIRNLDWMSDITKANALDKLNAMSVNIGYPDEWTDMSGLVIDPHRSFMENALECNRFNRISELEKKAGKTVDRNNWDDICPQTINAFYAPELNKVLFPAAILQKPLFDPDADDAYNYGSIGAFIGHEITHGFDNIGWLFDKDGNVTDWWAESDKEQFNNRTDVFVNYFSAIEVLPGLYANGQLTLGENIADLGGLQIAWTAYKNATKKQELPDIDGLTPDQRFFLAYTGAKAENVTDETIRYCTNTDPHSLGNWRVNGILPHCDAWYDAFGIKEGDKMFIPKKQRASIW